MSHPATAYRRNHLGNVTGLDTEVVVGVESIRLDLVDDDMDGPERCLQRIGDNSGHRTDAALHFSARGAPIGSR
ncbi:hypothetical protein [Nocardia fusca]|uniref:hypothetical protein n=1 Tax=Nocardia fusca TaxID=941183 RepID=UPI0007A733F5|nr:hypothetical protein [Nocardia fusca]